MQLHHFIPTQEVIPLPRAVKLVPIKHKSCERKSNGIFMNKQTISRE